MEVNTTAGRACCAATASVPPGFDTEKRCLLSARSRKKLSGDGKALYVAAKSRIASGKRLRAAIDFVTYPYDAASRRQVSYALPQADRSRSLCNAARHTLGKSPDDARARFGARRGLDNAAYVRRGTCLSAVFSFLFF